MSKKTARLLFDGQGSPPFLYLIFRRSEVIVDSSTNSKTMRRCKFLFWIALIFFIPFCSLTAKETPTVSSAVALHKLEDGNKRFVEGKNTFPDIGAERRGKTAKNGQQPFATVISCSDSRLPVEILFDQGIGDIFVVRVAGNVCNVDEIGSAEYGVDHLGTPVLVVLGHSKCGAVSAVVQGAELNGNLPALLHGIIPAVEKVKRAIPMLRAMPFCRQPSKLMFGSPSKIYLRKVLSF